ncbi:MAG: transcription termination factor NusA [Bacilli bacterium]|nr:transcription termination factor NusA [Bacilli bacterium]
MDVKAFSESIDLIANAKGISHEAIVASLKEAMETSYIKYLKGGDDAMVEAVIDEVGGHITLCQKKWVVKEVEDDYLQISKEDALEDAEKTIADLEAEIATYLRPRGEEKLQRDDLKHLLSLVEKEKKNIKEGNAYSIYCPLSELTKFTTSSVKTILKAKITEAERVALYDIYKDQIGEMITGKVVAATERGVTIDIGRTTVELGKKDMIGDEFFKVDDVVKVYIQEAKPAENELDKGPQIEVTRSSEGFLKRLFEDEIHEIYEGTVLIKGIARIAGVRSKVAVASLKEDVDPTGACIGTGGSRIQKIVAQLGNSHEKEKIDIIPYTDDKALFIAESLRPAKVLGVGIKPLDEEETEPGAYVIVEDGQYSLALGKKSANIRLAKKLTGYAIEIYEETAAKEDGIEFETVEAMRARVEEEKKAHQRADYAARTLRLAEEKEALRKSEEEMPTIELGVEDEETLAAEEAAPVAVEETLAAAPVAKEEAPAPAPVEEKEPEIRVEVKTTITLDDLEKDLANTGKSEKKGEKKKFKKDDKKPHKVTEKEVPHVAPEAPINAMPIYTEEELAEVEAEEIESDYYSEEDENLEYEYNDEYYDE